MEVGFGKLLLDLLPPTLPSIALQADDVLASSPVLSCFQHFSLSRLFVCRFVVISPQRSQGADVSFSYGPSRLLRSVVLSFQSTKDPKEQT